MFRILVMIDDPEEQAAAMDALRSCGYRVSAATCDFDVAAGIDEYSTDLVLLDADLPGDQTIDLLRAIRENPPSSAVPVVVAGSRESTPELLMACAFGAADFLLKPLDPGIFRSRIARVIQVAMADPATWVGRSMVGIAA